MNSSENATNNATYTKLKDTKALRVILISVILVSFATSIGIVAQVDISRLLTSARNSDSANAATYSKLSLGDPISTTVSQKVQVPLFLTVDNEIAGIDVKIQFNSSDLLLEDILTGPNVSTWTFLPQDSQGGFTKSAVIQNANASGIIDYGMLLYSSIGKTIIDSRTGVTNLEVSKFTFTAKRASQTEISVLHTPGITTDSNVASLVSNQDVLLQTQNITINISPAPTTVPSLSPTATPIKTPLITASPVPTRTPTPARTPSPAPTTIASSTISPTSTPIVTNPTIAPVTPRPAGNKGLQFDGYNDQVSIQKSLPLLTAFTVEAFIRPSKSSASGIILAAGDDINGWSVELGRGRLEFWIASPNGTWSSLRHSITLARNNWYHVAATYSQGLVRLYVNGQSQGTTRQMTSVYNPSGVFQIGGLRKYPHFAGIIDDVRVSQGAIYNTNFSRVQSFSAVPNQTIALYQFNEGTGQSLYNQVNSSEYQGLLGQTNNTENSDPVWVNVQR